MHTHDGLIHFLFPHPSVAIGTAALALLYAGAALWFGKRPTRGQAAYFACALAAIVIAHGPVDELAEHQRLFFMHMLQHFIQTLVIPPLLLLGTPAWMLRPWVLSRALAPFARTLTRPLGAYATFSALFVVMHFTPLFELMCRNEPFHIAVHLAFMATGVLLWWPVAGPVPELPRLSYPGQVMYLFLLMIPMIAVAAPITLATEVIYPWYLEGPHGLGLKPIDDQVLGGLLMWIGQGLYLMCAFTLVFFRWAREAERDEPPSELEIGPVPVASRPVT